MLQKKAIRTWIGILCLSGMFLAGQEGWEPARISSGQTLSGEITPQTDTDSYTFSASEGGVAVFQIVRTSGDLTPGFMVYDGGGFEDGTSTAGSSVYYPVYLPGPGTYTIVVGDLHGNPDTTGGYEISLMLIPGEVTYPLDPDGGTISSAQTLSGTIDSIGDADGFRFTAPEGGVALIQMVRTSGAYTPGFMVYDGGGFEDGMSTAGSSVYYPVYLPGPGTYTVLVSDLNGYADTTGGYDMTLILIPGGVTHPSDPDGGTISSGQTLSGTIDSIGDVDGFRFTAPDGGVALIQMVRTSGDYTPGFMVYDGGGFEDGWSTAGSSVYYPVYLPGPGTYTVLAGDLNGYADATGGYDMTLVLIPGVVTHPSDPDGGIISSGQTLSGAIDSNADVDGFRFTAPAGGVALIQMVRTSGDYTPGFMVYDGGGFEDGWSTAGSSVDYPVYLPGPGTYTILVSDLNGQADTTGGYAISLRVIPGA